ncbi:MAG TPA: DUF4384 domain-containing protein [Candidatus Limnocylindrales bacterium]|nr:DUF4384 domain-containing protein [Candidatus Limnocylindrales bacterium]
MKVARRYMANPRTALVAVMMFAAIAPAQERGIKPDEFIQARPIQKTHAVAATAHPVYKPLGPAAAVPASAGNVRQIGMTIWRLRPARKTDTGARIIVQEQANDVEWTPERISTTTPLKIGEHLRFSFEAAQKGFLYVIDRERYADNSLGEPTLIFPTTRLRNGENAVTPGQLIEIPDQGDQPNYFTLQRSRADQSGEELVLLLTPEPLPEIKPGTSAQVLPAEKVAAWEKAWGHSAQELELVGGAGRAWTKAEQQAGKDQTRLLTQADPSPQTVYRVSAGPNDPVVVHVQLRYGAAK